MRSLRAFLAAGKSGEVVLFAARGCVQRAELNEVVIPKKACDNQLTDKREPV
jgi:hypothetical protein